MPCPPVSVIEPVIRPTNGFCPNAVAKPMPTKFYTKIKMLTIIKKATSGKPPCFRREKSADKPIDEKNTSIKVDCKDASKVKVMPMV